jgi:hypothetical protein
MKEMINKLNLLSYNKKEIIKNTWAKDESSDDDFQKDLEREDSPRYLEYKKSKEKSNIESSSDSVNKKISLKYSKEHSKENSKEHSNVESSSEAITTDSVAKKVSLSLKKPKKFIIKIDTETDNDTDIAKQVFIDMYSN